MKHIIVGEERDGGYRLSTEIGRSRHDRIIGAGALRSENKVEL